MTTATTVYDTAAGALATLHGQTLRAIPTTTDYAYAPDHDAAVILDEAHTALEWSVTATYDEPGRRLTVTPDQHVLDTDGEGPAGGIAFLRASDDLPVAWLPFSAPFDGEATITFPHGIAALLPGATFSAIILDHADRIAALEASEADGGGSGLPEPIPEDGGRPLITDGDGGAGWLGFPIDMLVDALINQRLDTTSADPGDVLTVGDPGDPATWAPPPAAGWGSWIPGTSSVVSTRTDGVEVAALWVGPAGPIVGSTPGPVAIDQIDLAHAPPADVPLAVTWYDELTEATGPALLMVSSAGLIQALDLSGTLTDTDDVQLLLGAARWWLA